MKIPVSAALICLSLCACGPKEIGEGHASDNPPIPEATAADNMRMPVTGINNTERLLHYYTRRDVMERLGEGQLYMFRRRLGIRPEDPAYRAVPRQKSPFRQ